ncbi:MAG: CDP-glucose 4,6-dehydratase [Bacteroidota bacterium]
MELKSLENTFKNKRVFLTGHTGFKGSWMTCLLQKLGAEVKGYALESNTQPNHISLLPATFESFIGDIRDETTLKNELIKFQPDLILHLAAQPLVRYSYTHPKETYETNVIGTLNVYEAAKACSSVKAIVSITTDKVYQNNEWHWGYRENDALGGYDPYSSSKACAEILTSSYRNSFFNIEQYQKSHQILLASARAGNVIGGGDWSLDRLIPDIIKATVSKEAVIIRNPNAQRPWQHVVEPLYGYLLLAEKLLTGQKEFAQAFNFGPDITSNVSVGKVCEIAKLYWDDIKIETEKNQANKVHEANLLFLDSTKSRQILNWIPKWDIHTTVQQTIEWYKAFYENKEVRTSNQIDLYFK